MPRPRYTVSVSLTPEEFEKLKKYCEDKGLKYSTAIKDIILKYLEGQGY